VHLRYVTPDEVRQAITPHDGRATVTRLVNGWMDVVDEHDRPLRFTQDNLAGLLEDSEVVEAILTGIRDKMQQLLEMLEWQSRLAGRRES
jgi:hypothetical protein